MGKQRSETKQIILALEGNPSKWRNHTATVMWEDYVPALAQYGFDCCSEWVDRGYKDDTQMFFVDRLQPEFEMPYWFGIEEFHRSHRSNLLRKDPVFYGQYGWTEPNNLPYYWPESVHLWRSSKRIVSLTRKPDGHSW